MPYTPPTGWLEALVVNPDDKYPIRERFHTRPNCPRIDPNSELRKVDRPYTDVRCAKCANPQ